MTTQPAIVRGNVRTAVAVFIDDSNGDLVDIEYYCEDMVSGHAGLADGALPWPCYEFSTDSATYCTDCGALIHNPTA